MAGAFTVAPVSAVKAVPPLVDTLMVYEAALGTADQEKSGIVVSTVALFVGAESVVVAMAVLNAPNAVAVFFKGTQAVASPPVKLFFPWTLQ